MSTLALDTGTRLGYALPWRSGAHHLLREGEDEWRRPGNLWRFLDELGLEAYGRGDPIRVIVAETAFGFSQKSGFAVDVGPELRGVMKAWASLHGADYKIVWPSSLKKFATGNGAAGRGLKGKAKKQPMIDAAREKLGYTGDDPDEVDAKWILEFHKAGLTEKAAA